MSHYAMLTGVEGDRVPSETTAPVESGAIQLSRAQGGYRDLLRRYAVLIDEVQAGRIGRGQTLRFDVSPGLHELQLKIDWCFSTRLTTEVEPGDSVYFACSPSGDASEGLAAVTANKGDYISLWRTAEPVAATIPPMGWGMRFRLGTAFGFFAGGLTLIGAWIWRYAAEASAADNMVVAVSLAVTVASMIAFKLGRRQGSRHRRPT
jgi:hypothetical protein